MGFNRNFFFGQVRGSLFGGRLTTSQINGLTAILDEWEAKHANQDDRWLAYMLATVHHETDRQFRGIEEYGKGRTRPYGKKLKMNRQAYQMPDKLYYGRGFVQLTWYENYEKAGKKLGIDLLNKPELALDLGNCVKILFLGMMEGWFTGRKLSSYFTGTKEDWITARRIINGLDKANLISAYGKRFYAAISYTTA
jgi:hypothetical protein